MNFSVPQKVLSDLVGAAVKICNGRSTVQIAGCIKLMFGADGFGVAATDFENWITLATKEFTPTAVAIVPGRQLHSIISGMAKDQDVSFNITEKRLVIKTDSSKYQMGLQDAEEWPEVKMGDGVHRITLDSHEFLQAISYAVTSSAVDDARHMLNGVSVSAFDEKLLRFHGCDGHQASQAILDLDKPTEAPAIIIGRPMIQHYITLLAALDAKLPVTLDITESKICFGYAGRYIVSMISKLVDGTYPDIDRLIQHDRVHKIYTVDRADLLAALQRLVTMADEKKRCLTMTMTGGMMKLSTQNEFGNAEEFLSITSDGPEVTVACNMRLLHNLVNAISSNTVAIMLGENFMTDILAIASDPKQVAVTGREFSILMPMRG